MAKKRQTLMLPLNYRLATFSQPDDINYYDNDGQVWYVALIRFEKARFLRRAGWRTVVERRIGAALTTKVEEAVHAEFAKVAWDLEARG